MQKLMLEWADEFEGLQKDVFYKLGINVKNACGYILDMPDGVAKDKLKVFLSDIRTLID